MSQKTETVCDACGADLRYTIYSIGYRLTLASQVKPRHPDAGLAVSETYVANPLPEAKHFCDLDCLGNWTRGDIP